MAIEDDFTVALNGDIRYTGGGSTYYTVLELHRFLQGLADDEEMASASSDFLDITSVNPSTRSTDNIITLNGDYNIDDDAAEQLYNGSILQGGGDTLYAGLVVVGEVESGTELMIFRDNSLITSWWGTGINADSGAGIIMRTLIRIRGDDQGSSNLTGCLLDGGKIRVEAREFNDVYAFFNVTLGLGNSTAAIFTSDDLNNDTVEGTVSGWTTITDVDPGYNAIDVDNDGTDEYYYSEWDKDTYTINQLYERTKWIQRRGSSTSIHGMNGQYFRGISHSITYDGKSGTVNEDDTIGWGTWFNFDTGTSTENYTEGNYVKVGTNDYLAKIVYYYTTDNGVSGTLVLAMEDTSQTISDGDIITELATSYEKTINGTVTDNDKDGGTGVILADDTGDSKYHIQMLTGVAPQDDMRMYSQDNDGYALVNVTVTTRTVNPEFLGQSTGSAIIGAFGIGIEYADLSSADSLTALDGTARSPPNNQTFTVTGLVSGEDRLLVAANDGADSPDLDQYSLQTTLDAAGTTSVVVTGEVAGYTPNTGWLRIQMDSNPTKSGDLGRYKIVSYTAWTFSTNTTFTITSTDFSSDVATAGNNVFVGLIDKQATSDTETFTGVYTTDKSLVGRVRDGGASPIVPFDTPATFNSGGGGFAAIRQNDT